MEWECWDAAGIVALVVELRSTVGVYSLHMFCAGCIGNGVEVYSLFI